MNNNNNNNINNNNDKFSTPTEYFIFGNIEDYQDGLLKKIHIGLFRSMKEECYNNDNGKWKNDFEYVVNEAAIEKIIDPNIPHRIRDQGHEGMILNDFLKHQMAIDAKLTQAEVASLRLYTGPFYIPWNTALRKYKEDPTLLENWQTFISVLYSAILKLSFLSKPGKVYRGVNESIRKLNEEFYNINDSDFAGGVELAFMSTTYVIDVAVEYA